MATQQEEYNIVWKVMRKKRGGEGQEEDKEKHDNSIYFSFA
jgi:hypothetical protein